MFAWNSIAQIISWTSLSVTGTQQHRYVAGFWAATIRKYGSLCGEFVLKKKKKEQNIKINILPT